MCASRRSRRDRTCAAESSVVAAGAGEVAVAEAVTVAFEREDLGVVDESIDHGGGDDVVAEDLAKAENGLLLVTIRLARS